MATESRKKWPKNPYTARHNFTYVLNNTSVKFVVSIDFFFNLTLNKANSAQLELIITPNSILKHLKNFGLDFKPCFRS